MAKHFCALALIPVLFGCAAEPSPGEGPALTLTLTTTGNLEDNPDFREEMRLWAGDSSIDETGTSHDRNLCWVMSSEVIEVIVLAADREGVRDIRVSDRSSEAGRLSIVQEPDDVIVTAGQGPEREGAPVSPLSPAGDLVDVTVNNADPVSEVVAQVAGAETEASAARVRLQYQIQYENNGQNTARGYELEVTATDAFGVEAEPVTVTLLTPGEITGVDTPCSNS